MTRNQGIGMFLRDQSGGNISRGSHQSIIHSNIIVNNEVEIGLESQNNRLMNELRDTNTIDGNVEYPEGVGCQIY